MKVHIQRTRRLIQFLFSTVTLSFTVGTANAQQPAIPPLSPITQRHPDLPRAFEQKIQFDAAKMSMDEILAAIMKRTHISFLVDDQPFLERADLRLDGTLHDALDKVADAFDYSWTLSKRGVVLMSKRFENPNERPQANLPEMLEMTRNMIRALTLVDYDRDGTHWADLVTQTAKTFTPEQMKALQSGEHLRGSDLLPNQKIAFQQASLSNAFVSSLDIWEQHLPNLENMQRSYLQARKRDSVKAILNDPTHDYLYVYRGANGQLHVFQFQHMRSGTGNEQGKTQ